MSEKSNIIDIVNGLSQAAANAYDGSLDENGEPIKVGLTREEGNPVLDMRVIDGFNVSISGNILIVKYQGESLLRDVYKGDFEGEVAQKLQDIISFLKKEYKKITGNALTLKSTGDVDAIVQQTSRIRTWVQAKQYFDIGGVDSSTEAINGASEDSVDAKFKSFLDQGGWDTGAPQGQPVRKDGKVKSRKDIHSPFKAE